MAGEKASAGLLQRVGTGALLGGLALLHCAEVEGYLHELRSLSVQEQKVSSFKTENAFYFSFFEEMVQAPSAWHGLEQALNDRRSEAPDVINAIQRFNIYQEIVIGLMFHLVRGLLGASFQLEPLYFFRMCSCLLQGAGQLGLLYLAASLGGGGFRGAVLPGVSLSLMSYLHRKAFSRIRDVGMQELRENWAIPVFLCQVLALHKLIVTFGKRSCQQGLSQVWLWAFGIFTVLCLLLWQFSAFIFLLQVSALFLCTLLARSITTRQILEAVVASHLLAGGVAILLLFGNELLVHHHLLTQCLAIWVVLRARPFVPGRWFFWVDGALAVLLFGILRLLQSPFATADEHVWELYLAKLRQLLPSLFGQVAPKEPTFNARLYFAVSVFGFIDWPTVAGLNKTFIYHFASTTAVLVLLGFVARVMLAPTPLRSAEMAEESGKEVLHADAFASCVLVIQTTLYLMLGAFISRLRCIGAPFLLLLAAVAAAPKPIQVLIGVEAPRGRWLKRSSWILLFILASWVQLGQLVFLLQQLPFLPGLAYETHRDMVWQDGDRGEFYEWMVGNIEKDEIILAAMPLSAEMRLNTPFRFAIHPQYEAHHLRERVQELYQWYQCVPPRDFAQTVRKYGARHLIVEYRRCNFSPFKLDKWPEYNCDSGDRPWSDLFCAAIHISPDYEMLWANSEYGVFRLREPSEPRPKLQGKAPDGVEGGSLEDPRVWQDYLSRCLETDPKGCPRRMASLGTVFSAKLQQPAVGNILLQWALQHGFNDAKTLFILGHHIDFDLQRPADAGRHYERAAELKPNDPVILKEYMMWLDLIKKDNRTLYELLVPRRYGDGKKRSIMELRDPKLACEAAVVALQLFYDATWAMELWQFAVREAAGSECVKINWPLLRGGKSLEEDVSLWGLFLNVFWHHRMKSDLASATQIPLSPKDRKTRKFGLHSIFNRSMAIHDALGQCTRDTDSETCKKVPAVSR